MPGQKKSVPHEAPSIRVAIVDDHPVARNGISDVFARYQSIDVVSSTDSIEKIQPILAELDIALIDLYLAPGRVTPATIAEIAEACRVIVISDTIRQADITLARKSGASGFLAKSLSDESYIEALLVAFKGGFYEPLTARPEPSATPTLDSGSPQHPVLAPREHQVLSYLALGFTLKETAAQLGISPTTVDTYLKRIRKKLGPGNQATLIRKAVQVAGFDAWQELNTKEPTKRLHNGTRARR